jgi:hypothetical protein
MLGRGGLGRPFRAWEGCGGTQGRRALPWAIVDCPFGAEDQRLSVARELPLREPPRTSTTSKESGEAEALSARRASPPKGRCFGEAMSSSPFEKLRNGDDNDDVATLFHAGAWPGCAQLAVSPEPEQFPHRQHAGPTRGRMSKNPVGCLCRPRRYRDRYRHRNRQRSGACGSIQSASSNSIPQRCAPLGRRGVMRSDGQNPALTRWATFYRPSGPEATASECWGR